MMKKSDKIFIAGHNGFVGNALHNKLKLLGYENIITADHSSLDLTNQRAVNTFFLKNDIDYVFMCAAKVGGIQYNIDHQYESLLVNSQIQNNLIYVCNRHNIKTLFLGSSCIYPKNCKQPMKEEYLMNSQLEPTNEGYALAKISGLKMCEFANKNGGQFISLMPCNIYGIGENFDENSHVVGSLIRKFSEDDNVEIWGSGIARRELLYISDLIDAMIWSMNNLDKTDTFLNVGSGNDMSIKELAELISRIFEFKGTINYNSDKPEGMLRKCLDVQNINNLGWKSKIDIEGGLTRTIHWYKGNKK